MKKFMIILLMLVYGLSSSGMTINLHYCCGKLDDISFSGKQGSKCGMGDHSENSDCCKDKQISAGSYADQEQVVKSIQTLQQTIAAPVYHNSNTSFTDHIVSVNQLARGTLVPITSVPLFIKNCIFRV